MERLEPSDVYIQPEVLEAERALNPPQPPSAKGSLRWRIERYPWRLDLRDLFATIGEVLLWGLVGMEAMMWLMPIVFGEPGGGSYLAIYLAYPAGVAAFSSVSYFSLKRYRHDFLRALEASDLSLQLAAGAIEGERPGSGSLLEPNAPRLGSMELLVWHIAQHPRKYFPFRNSAFSRTWMWIYYAFAVPWFLGCIILSFVMVMPVMPHVPWLELLLPTICTAHLRKVRHLEVTKYLSKMLVE